MEGLYFMSDFRSLISKDSKTLYAIDDQGIRNGFLDLFIDETQGKFK